jgi:uncharacterized protein with PIN domain
MGGMGMMIAKSIVSYMMFRSTKAITKAGVDSFGEMAGSKRLSRCPRCGFIDKEADNCKRCNGRMHKMYKEYVMPNNLGLIDDSL